MTEARTAGHYEPLIINIGSDLVSADFFPDSTLLAADCAGRSRAMAGQNRERILGTGQVRSPDETEAGQFFVSLAMSAADEEACLLVAVGCWPVRRSLLCQSKDRFCWQPIQGFGCAEFHQQSSFGG